MARYLYIWMPVFVVLGTFFILTSSVLALIALPFVLLFVLAGIAWIIVGVPYVLGRAVNRRWHARHAAGAQPAAALAQTERRERG